LEQARAKGGARSLSDFVRSQVLHAAGQPSLSQIETRLADLSLAVKQLTSMVNRSGGL
jgi:hypothetical protein